mgnify:FL=1
MRQLGLIGLTGLLAFAPSGMVRGLGMQTASAQRDSMPAADPDALFRHGVDEFFAGRIEPSVAAFDELARVAPRLMPQLWQRGIALYYAGRFDDCRRQFEAHRTVNPDDVENAAWHFLCVARAESPARAKAALLPVGPDARVPMREVYRLYRGEMTPEQVLRAGQGSADGQFYANLYVGLYYDAIGETAKARAAITTAADERYASSGGYMHRVARVHLGQLDRRR